MFTFQAPTRVRFGAGSADALAEEVELLSKAGRILLVTDKGIVAAGIAGRMVRELPQAEVFDEVEPNPRQATVDRAGELARRLKPAVVVGLGGGPIPKEDMMFCIV